VACELGELQREIAALPDAQQRFRAVKLPLNTQLLGCRDFRQSLKSECALVSASIAKTLRQTEQDPAAVDMLIIASADSRCLGRSLDTKTLLEANGLSRAVPLGTTLQECASLVAAIATAVSYLSNSSLQNILVASVDIVRDDSDRILPTGVLSDAAASCLISRSVRRDFDVIATCSRVDLKGMKGLDDFGSRKRLALEVSERVLQDGNASIDKLRKVFSTNFFQPVAQFNAAALGLRKDQLYFEHSLQTAHCACADPLVGLSHFQAKNSFRAGEQLLLQSYAPGFLAAALLRSASPSA
jgi:3-oxoacyl-[acyl-carrier-protein] synthase-3